MKHKSYYIVGNLPVYNGKFPIDGCEYIINTRIKYENSVCVFQFNKQSEAFVFTKSSEEFELDLASLVRLKTFIEYIMSDSSYRTSHFFSSTTLQQHKKMQKSVYIKPANNSFLEFIFKNNSFKLIDGFEGKMFLEIVKTCIVNLERLQGDYDFDRLKNERSPGAAISISAPASISSAPKPVRNATYIHSSEVPTSPPLSNTKEVIPQAPAVPKYVPAVPTI